MLPEINRTTLNRGLKILVPLLVIGLVSGLAVIIYNSVNNAGNSAKWQQTCVQAANESDYKVEESLNIFDLKLLRQILAQRAPGSNVILSSFSAASVLSMILAGVKEDKASDLHQVLTLPCGQNSSAITDLYLLGLSQSYGKQQNDSGFSLEAANNIYVDNHLNLDPDFEQQTSRYFHSVPERLDFANNAESSRNRINQWVETKTKDKIQNLLPSGSINSMTKMVLVNAIYFKGTWLQKFEKADTNDSADFFLENGKDVVKVSMMKMEAKLMLGEVKDVMKIIKIPYIGDQIAMYIFSPMHDHTVQEALDIYNQLDVEDEMLDSMDLELHLPKFNIESDYDLKQILQDLGLKSIFSPNALDVTDDGTNLMVDLIVQKAFIDVNEEGTEAAAATGITLRNLAHRIPQAKIVLNRPFLFIIKNTLTGINLFSGCVYNPSSKP